VKYLATTVREIACDNEAMGQGDLVSIVESWAAAPAGSPPAPRSRSAAIIRTIRRTSSSSPRFRSPRRGARGREARAEREKYCLIVVAEGSRDADGNYVAADAATDAFGHATLGGAAMPSVKSSAPTFPARKCASRSPASCSVVPRTPRRRRTPTRRSHGQAAVKAAINGETDKMVTLIRGEADHYTVETASRPSARLRTA